MKKLKGFISILLSVVLMLSSVCSINLFAYAEEQHDYVLNQVEPTITTQGYDEYVCSNCGDSYRVNERYLSIQLGETMSINLGAGQTAMLQFTPNEDATLIFSSSGTKDTYGEIYDSEMNLITGDDDNGTGNNFLVKYLFEAGKTYILTCRLYNSEASGGFDVSLMPNPADSIDSVEFTPAKPYIFIQNTYGNDNNGVWEYHPPRFNDGDILTVYNKDGTTSSYTYASDSNAFLNENGESIEAYSSPFSFDGTGETTFQIYVPIYEKYASVPVSIIEDPVASVEFTAITPYEIIQNTNGWDNNGVWEYNAPDPNGGDKITINYTDSHSEEYIFNQNNYQFINEDGTILEVNRYSFQFNGVGETTFEIDLPSIGKRISVPVKIIENPIANIEFTPIKPYEIIQNTNGYEEWDGSWCYYAPNFENGDSIKIHYTDGHTEQYTFDSDYYEFRNENNETLSVYSRSFYFTGVGETSFDIMINNLGIVSVPVTIIESPIADFEFIPANDFKFIENIGCSTRQGEDGEYAHYNNLLNKGDKVIITTKDGETITYTHTGYGSGTSSDRYEITEFRNEKYEVIKIGMYHNQPTEHWTLGNQYQVNISCLGVRKSYTISIVENPVASVSVNLIKPIKITKDTNGWRDESSGKWYYSSVPFNEGDSITLHFKDGTEKVFINKVVDNDESWKEFLDENNNSLSISRDSFTFDGLGETTVEVELYDYGKKASVNVEIIEDNVLSITATPVTKVVEKNGGYCDWFVSDDGIPYCGDTYYYYTIEQKIDITVSYTDGTTKTFKNVGYGDIVDSYDLDFRFDNATSENYKVGDKIPATVNLGSESSNRTCTVEFEIVENPVADVRVTQKPITEICNHFGGNPAGENCIYCAINYAEFEFVLKDGTTQKVMGNNLLSAGMGSYSSAFYPITVYARINDCIIDITFYKNDLTNDVCKNGDVITYYSSGKSNSVTLEIPTKEEHTHTWGEWTVKTPAVYNVSDTVMTRTCPTCNETEDYEVPNTRKLRVNAINLTLGSNIAINARINQSTVNSANFASVYCVVEKIRSSNGNRVPTTINKSKFIDGDTPRMQYVYEEMNPQNMMDTYDITFYAVTTDGMVVPGETYSYKSIAQYARDEIRKASNASKTNYKRMLVDMLKYGAQAQIYMNYDTETLATSVLTDEELALGSLVTVPEYVRTQVPNCETINNPTRGWKSIGLILDSAVRVRLRLGASSTGTPMTDADLQNIAVRVAVEGGVTKLYTYEENPELFVPGGKDYPNEYYFYFNDLAVSQIRNNVYYTICDKDGNALSNTLLYKPESFVMTKTGSLKNLLDAMMVYADSCRDFVANSKN